MCWRLYWRRLNHEAPLWLPRLRASIKPSQIGHLIYELMNTAVNSGSAVDSVMARDEIWSIQNSGSFVGMHHQCVLYPCFINEVKKIWLTLSISDHVLSLYSLHLNPIRWIWKLMNGHTCNNLHFASVQEFRDSMSFFTPFLEIAMLIASRIIANFKIVKKLP